MSRLLEHKPLRFRRRGFSLLEVIVTVVILSIALVPIFAYFGSAPKRSAVTMHRALAHTLANQLLERYRAVPYDTLQRAFGQGEEQARSIISQDPLIRWEAQPRDIAHMVRNYEYTRDIVFEPVQGQPGLALLRVYVRWKMGDVPPREVQISRVIVDYAKVGSVN